MSVDPMIHIAACSQQLNWKLDQRPEARPNAGVCNVLQPECVHSLVVLLLEVVKEGEGEGVVSLLGIQVVKSS